MPGFGLEEALTYKINEPGWNMFRTGSNLKNVAEAKEWLQKEGSFVKITGSEWMLITNDGYVLEEHSDDGSMFYIATKM